MAQPQPIPLNTKGWVTDPIHDGCVVFRSTLFQAVIAGNIAEVSTLLNSNEYSRISLLGSSAKSFHAVNLRAGSAVKINGNDSLPRHYHYQYTCLHFAITHGHDSIVDILLKCQGIDVNIGVQSINSLTTVATPINVAAVEGNLRVFHKLLDLGATTSNATLHCACSLFNNHGSEVVASSEIYRWLLNKHGIDGNHSPVDCLTIATDEHDLLATAINYGNAEIVMLLIEFCNESQDISQWFSLERWANGIIPLYQHALALPQQHQPLLDFHMCLNRAYQGSSPASALNAFVLFWPPVVGNIIECFLLPSKKVRRTMGRIVTHFEDHLLNDVDAEGYSLLRSVLFEMCEYEGYGTGDMKWLTFLLAQENLDVNQLIACDHYDDNDTNVLKETCLRFALRLGGLSKYNVNAEMIAALVNAGGRVEIEELGDSD
jgi:hypothetical protein